ncbi:MAG: hypothetical protein HC906_08910 [Bacteroidales bacterium]|nr:hypothetical protein [Bacteroidales bacterium]
MFEWDTYFGALLTGMINKDVAYSNVFAITHKLNRFGAVSFTQQPRNQLADNSQPPVGSMVCWKLYEKYGEKWFLDTVYNSLMSWNEWWLKNRMNNGYLTWGASWNNATEQDARWESGLDNSPMYDDVKIKNSGHNSLLNLADVGLNSMYVMDCQYLQKMANVLGKKNDYAVLKKREEEISKAIQSLWNEEYGIYLNKYIDSDTFSTRLSPTLFYPMIAGIPGKEQAKKMLEKHFYNPEEFYGEYIIPSCARNDKGFNNQYWQGAIWGPLNFLVYLGLKNYSEEATSELATKSFNLFQEAWLKHNYVFENINSEKGVLTIKIN